MKKFLTNISLQPEGQLKSYQYKAINNQKLESGRVTSFPITCAIDGYLSEGESFALIAVMEDNVNARRNLELLRAQTDEICLEKKFICAGLQTVLLGSSKQPDALAENFLQIIDQIDDRDELFADITFGTKPQSMILQNAVQYAYCVKDNIRVRCIVYGDVDRTNPDRSKWAGEIYDETALVKLDNIIWRLADAKIANPRAMIETIVHL